MDFRMMLFAVLLVLGQVARSYSELSSGILGLHICNKDDEDKVSNIEILNEVDDRQLVYVHSSPSFSFLRIKANVIGCKRRLLNIEKYLIPGDLGIASKDSRYLLELHSDVVMGQLVYHIRPVKDESSGVQVRSGRATNDTITVSSGLGCGHIHSYLLEALGATLCTPYRLHHADEEGNEDNTLRVYADNYENAHNAQNNIEDRNYKNDKGTLTVGGKECIFPFLFKGVEYNTCAPGTSQPHPWCATAINDDKTEETWDVCVNKELSSQSVPPQKIPVVNWKPFIPWVIIHYFYLRSWQSRTEVMGLTLTLGMYLLYLIVKSRRDIRIFRTREQERAVARIV